MKRRLLSGLMVFLAAGLLLAPATAFAFDPFGSICNSTDQNVLSSTLCSGKNASDPTQNPLTGQKGLLRGIANIIAIVAGLAAVIIIVISGARFITSGGEAAKTKAARDAIAAAIIGLVIIVLAESIIGFVISRV